MQIPLVYLLVVTTAVGLDLACGSKDLFTIFGRSPDIALTSRPGPSAVFGPPKPKPFFPLYTGQCKYFYNEAQVVVHYDGFLSMDKESTNTLKDAACQVSPLDETGMTLNYIPVYWQQYEAGSVHMFKKNLLTPVQLQTIADDISVTFNEKAAAFYEENESLNITVRDAINVKYIQDVWVITWFRMRAKRNNKAQQKETHDTFQALLVKVQRKGSIEWYLKTHLDTLSSNGGCAPTQIGIGLSNTNTNGEGGKPTQRVDLRERFGNALPTVFEDLTNEHRFANQSSYSFDLNSGTVNQPTPPSVICPPKKCAKNKQAQVELAKSRNLFLQLDPDFPDREDAKRRLKKFCRFRDDGEHALPANCDVFIYCSHGQGFFMACPEGTKFNPVIRVCDFPVNFECKFDGFNVTDLRPLFPQPKTESDNICFFSENGQIVDPSSCDHYYSCSNTQSIRMPCPAGLFFNPSSEKRGFCNFQKNVRCTGKGDRS